MTTKSKAAGTVTIDGATIKTTGTFKFAALYRPTFDASKIAGCGETWFTFHRSEAAAAKPNQANIRGGWEYVGYAAIEF